MHASTALLSLLSAAGAIAAPTTNAVSAMAEVPQWTIKSYTRTCDSADTSCKVSFSVDTKVSGAKVQACSFTLKKTGNTPASQAPIANVGCVAGAGVGLDGPLGDFGHG